MCAVIGVLMQNPSNLDFDLIHKIFLESSIRGLHATGLSYVKDNIVHTISFPVPANKFEFNFLDYINEDGNLYLIGHCRYSTSDLEYNQPISNKNISVVHNGVITQELPEKWKELYGYDCSTKNDSELLLHTIEENISPLIKWKDSSLAVCTLSANKTLQVFRNGKRPIYVTSLNNSVIITSTENIPKRAGIKEKPIEVALNTYVTYDNNLNKVFKEEIIENSKDFQHL
jgi:glutamine phosphoribosylpyrophosphate amidotransferase